MMCYPGFSDPTKDSETNRLIKGAKDKVKELKEAKDKVNKINKGLK